MKVLSLNLHCFAENNYLQNQRLIAKTIFEEEVDIVFLQEVAQPLAQKVVYGNLRRQNYGYALKALLKEHGQVFEYYYDVSNKAYQSDEEGLAYLAKYPLISKQSFTISKTDDYDDWHTRKALSAKAMIPAKMMQLCNVHMGWTDEVEKFEDQFDAVMEHLNTDSFLLLGGDFNMVPGSKEYEYVLSKGWIDIAKEFDKKQANKATFVGDENLDKSRIDYFFTNKAVEVKDYRRLFTEDPVSDHFGVLVEFDLA